MTLAFEDANSKLLDVVSVADVDAEERVDDILVEILKLVGLFLNTGAFTPLGVGPAGFAQQCPPRAPPPRHSLSEWVGQDIEAEVWLGFGSIFLTIF